MSQYWTTLFLRGATPLKKHPGSASVCICQYCIRPLKPAILASHISHDLTTYYTDLGVLPIYCINKCQNIVAVKRNSNPQPFKFKFLRLQCASNEKGILKQLVAIARIRETTVKDFFECQLYFKNLKRPFNKTPR